jgi:hypothetical protein
MKEIFAGLVIALVAMIWFCPPSVNAATPNNRVVNGSFEKGITPWNFWAVSPNGTMPVIVCGKGVALSGNGRCVAELPIDSSGGISTPYIHISPSVNFTFDLYYKWLSEPTPEAFLEADVEWFRKDKTSIRVDYVLMPPPPPFFNILLPWAQYFSSLKSAKKAYYVTITMVVGNGSGVDQTFGVAVDRIELVRQ